MNVLSIFSKPRTNQDAVTTKNRETLDEGHITSSEGGWMPVGHDQDGSYMVLSRKTGQIINLQAQDLEPKKLVMLLGRSILEEHVDLNPRTKALEFSKEDLVTTIQKSCDEMGLFDRNRLRGPGLYQDGGELIVNYGDYVETSNGEPVSTIPLLTGPVYRSGPSLGMTPQTPAASQADVQALVSTIESFGIRRAGDAKLLLGWFVMAAYGPAISVHPIMAVTAERGAGKTTLLELFSRLLGPQAFRRDGAPTVAQVIYELENRHAALLVDELEARRDKLVAVSNLLDTLRSGFTNSSDDRISRIIGGKKRYFNAPAGALVAGIGLPAFNSPTDSRTVRICLDALDQGSLANYQPLLDSARASETAELGSRLRRLLVTRWSVMANALRLVRSTLIALGHESRSADKYATLVAGYLALTSASMPAAEELRSLLSELELDRPQKQVAERDSDVCLKVILDRKVLMYLPRGDGSHVKAHMTIREAIQAVIHGPAEMRKPLTMQLEDFGVRPMWSRDSNAWRLAVCSSEHHAGMRRLMQRTDWALGGWKDVLMRQPGAEYLVQKVAKSTQRVVMMDMPAELMTPAEEGAYDFPEQVAAEVQPA